MRQLIKNIFTIQQTGTSGRDEQIDFLRGGAMIFVLLHHSGFPLGGYILAFHMPFFFVLSGYLEQMGGGTTRTFKEYFKKRFIRLVVPYFCFEVVNLIIWDIKCLIENQSLPGIESVISIVTCINNAYMGLYGRLWFLPCMFVADVYVWLILRRFRDNKFGQILSILSLFALSFLSSKVIPFRLPFTLDTALFATAFIMLGCVFADVIKELVKRENDALKILLAFGALLYLFYSVRYTEVRVLMYINKYGEYTVSICAAIAGSIAFLVFGSYVYRAVGKITLLKNLVLWYGNNSLATFPVHLTIKMFILYYFPSLSKWYLMFAVMLICSIQIVNAITVYVPFMLGRKRTAI